MMENYTLDSMVQFLYRDMPADAAVLMTQQLEDDAELRESFNDLLQAKNQLLKASFNPSPTVLNNILNYSTKTALEAQF